MEESGGLIEDCLWIEIEGTFSAFDFLDISSAGILFRDRFSYDHLLQVGSAMGLVDKSSGLDPVVI